MSDEPLGPRAAEQSDAAASAEQAAIKPAPLRQDPLKARRERLIAAGMLLVSFAVSVLLSWRSGQTATESQSADSQTAE